MVTNKATNAPVQMTTVAKTKPKNFADYLKKSLSAESYDSLTATTGISRHKLTKIENNPRIATDRETRALALVLQKPVTWLWENFKMGYDCITIAQAEQIQKEAA